jgi:hypothetical protein
MDISIVVPSARLYLVERRKRRDPTAAERQQRARDRVVDGLRLASTIELPENRMARAAIERGGLSDDEALDWSKVCKVAQAVLLAWIDDGPPPPRHA